LLLRQSFNRLRFNVHEAPPRWRTFSNARLELREYQPIVPADLIDRVPEQFAWHLDALKDKEERPFVNEDSIRANQRTTVGPEQVNIARNEPDGQ
jgi:hypothetical protein